MKYCLKEVIDVMEVFAVTETTPKIYLGKQGENNAVPILFKVSTWINKYGEGGTFTLSHKRATDIVPYPATITLTDDGVLWLITVADNAIKLLFAEANGEGKTVLHFQNGAVKIIEIDYAEAVRILTSEA